MKTRIFSIVAALLLSVSAFAQSESPLKGDVNNDGTVDVADINAIIEIMKTGEDTEDPRYYYYAGWTVPTADNVDEIINETYPAGSGSSVINPAGKKTPRKSEMDYTTNKLYNAKAKATYYVLVPAGQAIYDSLGNNLIKSDVTFTTYGTITVRNKTHTIYAYTGTSRVINAIIIR